MSTSDNSLVINNSMKNLTIVSFPGTLKLTFTNYLGWKTQIEAILHGLDLHKYIDGTHPTPTPTVAADGTTTPHKDFQQWFRQDRLLYGALVGSLSPSIVPLITNASSSLDAWNILAATYASPSRGHIKQLQHRLKTISKTPNQSITEYMQSIKTVFDKLGLLGKKMDHEDLIDTVLNGLDPNTYKPTIDAIHARDTPIPFHELHEKLINHELSLAQQVITGGIHQPASVFYVHNKGQTNKPWNQHRSPNHNRGHGAPSVGILPTPSGHHTSSPGSRPFCVFSKDILYRIGTCSCSKSQDFAKRKGEDKKRKGSPKNKTCNRKKGTAGDFSNGLYYHAKNVMLRTGTKLIKDQGGLWPL